MKRTSTVEWNVELSEDKEYPGYVSLQVDPKRILLCLKDGTLRQDSVLTMDISHTELRQIKYMVDQSLELIKNSNLNSWGTPEYE